MVSFCCHYTLASLWNTLSLFRFGEGFATISITMRYTKSLANMGRLQKIIIGFVAFVLIMVAWGVYVAVTHKDEKPTATTTTTQNTTSQTQDQVENQTTVPSDEVSLDANPTAKEETRKVELIVTQQCEKEFGGYWVGWIFPQELEFNKELTFARGLTSCTDKNTPNKDVDAKSYQIFLKKINGKWDIIYRGVKPPCADWATQWGAPGDWAAAPPGYDPDNPTPCGS